MSTQYDQMIDLLKERGFRMTNARKHIVAMFDTDCEPMSALDVQRRLKKKKIDANQTTVYRELAFLEEQGLLQSVSFHDGVQRYELASLPHHHHMVCMKCKAVEDVTMEDELHAIEKKIAKKKQFTILRHSLEFYGFCKKCAL
jgi:Fe2+ or Zn2+ uptake regulation protein